MLKKKYYDGFTVHDILNKHLDDGHKILELLTAFADANGVDAVEVVRCKDCRFFKEQYLSIAGNKVPAHWCEEWFGNTRESGFCHMAERKEE